jgi:hypothetical protein
MMYQRGYHTKRRNDQVEEKREEMGPSYVEIISWRDVVSFPSEKAEVSEGVGGAQRRKGLALSVDNNEGLRYYIVFLNLLLESLLSH